MNREEKNWVLENRYRRLIVEILKQGAKTEQEIREKFKITLSPYLSSYQPRVQLKISPSSLKNHLALMVREKVVQKEGDRYCIKKRA